MEIKKKSKNHPLSPRFMEFSPICTVSFENAPNVTIYSQFVKHEVDFVNTYRVSSQCTCTTSKIICI